MVDDTIKDLCAQEGVELLVLFGSSSRGEKRPGSDVDLAVKMKKDRAVSKLDLLYRLGEIYKDREVDLVVLSVDTDPVLLFEIFTKGSLLYEAEPDLFENERLRALKLYYDTEKLRRFNDEYLRKFAERSRHVA